MKYVKLRAELPADRTKLGNLVMLQAVPVTSSVPDFPWKQVLGPLSCYAKADNLAAAAAGNPKRDPLQLYGDFPLGEYSCRLIVPPGTLGETFKREYGPYGFIELTPTSGDALTAAKNGRYGLRIHSGVKNQYGGLRPTHGCLRLSDEDFLALRQAIEALGDVTITLGADQADVVLPLAS